MSSFDLFDWLGPIKAASLLIPVAITGVVLVVVIWAIRRSVPAREDPAVAELKARLARGEIDPVEYEVRMRALRPPD